MRILSRLLILPILASVGCKSNELGNTPAIPPAPSEAFSQRSVCFDGQSSLSQVDTANIFTNVALALPVDKLSISFWIRMKNNNPSGIILGLDEANDDYFHVAWQSDGKIEFKSIYNGLTDIIAVAVNRPSDWHHIVMTFDGFEPTPELRKVLYVDGVAHGVDVAMEIPLFAGRFFQISPFHSPMGSGCLDDIGIWNRGLTGPEVLLLAEGSSPREYSGTVLDVDTLWLFEEAPGAVLLQDEADNLDLSTIGKVTLQSSIVDPFKPGDASDPLNEGNVGDNQGDSSGGSNPFEGGSDGYSGELGDGGSADGGFFP